MTRLAIKTCPTCGWNGIRRVKRDIESSRGGTLFIARGIEIEECPNCAERLFGPEALDEIAAQRPQPKRADRRKTA